MLRTASLIALAAALLAACAGQPEQQQPARAAAPPPPPPVQDPLYPMTWPRVAESQVRGAMLALADREWRIWGGRTVYLADSRVLVTPPGPEVWEHERPGFRPVAGYWRAVGTDYWARAQQAAGPVVTDAAGDVTAAAYSQIRVGDAPWFLPWSAAFTSWVVRMAGVPEQDFVFSETHHDYVADAIARYENARAGAGSLSALRFVPHEPEAYPVQPGDLVCATRGGTPLRHYSELLAGRRAMHCDIVVHTEEPCGPIVAPRCAAAIGGNVAQAVTRTVFPLESNGTVSVGDAGDGMPQRRAWIVVLENRYRTGVPVAALQPGR